MTKLRTGSSEEIYIGGDWRNTLAKRPGRYDVLLSDLTGGNIPYDERSDFYKTIALALHDDGIFLDKCLTHPIPHENLADLLEKYEWYPVNWDTVNRFNCEVFFCSTLLNRKEQVDTTEFYRLLLEQQNGDNVTRILQMMPHVTPEDMLWYYGRSWNEVRCMYQDYLVQIHISEEAPESPYYRRMKCIAWRRK